MKNNFLFCAHTTFFIFYSFLRSLFSVSLSSQPLHLFFLPPHNHKPFFLLQRPIADLHEPNHHRPVATNLRHFGLSSLFSAFRFCVSGCACVSALCFGLCLFVGLACAHVIVIAHCYCRSSSFSLSLSLSLRFYLRSGPTLPDSPQIGAFCFALHSASLFMITDR